MDLDNLRPAWRRYRSVNALERTDHDDILLILQRAGEPGGPNRFLRYAVMFLFLTFFCQGG